MFGVILGKPGQYHEPLACVLVGTEVEKDLIFKLLSG